MSFQPAPPSWLSEELEKLQTVFLDDLFQAVMRYAAVSTISDLALELAPNEPIPPDTKFMYYPRITCKDCPGKLYIPGPGFTVDNFKVHLRNRLHRERVERRVRLFLRDVQEPAPAPQR